MAMKMVYGASNFDSHTLKDDIVQKLIDEGHDVDGRITRFGMTPLYFAFTNCADKSSKGIYGATVKPNII